MTTTSQHIVDAAQHVSEITALIRATVQRGITVAWRPETACDEQNTADIKAALEVLLAQLDAAVRWFDYMLEIESEFRSVI